jgi:hypothetical protein
MSNHKSLEQSILDELDKTGYPTEIVSAAVMLRRAWHVIHNPSYLDEDEGDSREYDLYASKSWPLREPYHQFNIAVYLLAECKKSEKPWVFFCTPEEYDSVRLGEYIKGGTADKQIFTSKYASDSFISDDVLRSFHHYFQKGSLARTFYEPFKGQERADRSQMIYSAVMAAVKATLFHLRDRPFVNWLRIYYPVVIFSGDLFEAYIAPDKGITLRRSNHIQLSVNYILPNPAKRRSTWEIQHHFIIDVVHDTYLDQFLRLVEEGHEQLAQRLYAVLLARGT